MKIVDFLQSFLAGLMTKEQLAQAGASPEALATAITGQTALPTFGESVADEEARARSAIVTFMNSQIGKNYRLGVEIQPGHELDAIDWDCSEITEAAYRLAGRPLPDGSPQQFAATQGIIHPLPADLFFLWSDKWNRIGHVMVKGYGPTVFHAVGGRGVVEDSIERWQHHPRGRGWRRHVDFARPAMERA